MKLSKGNLIYDRVRLPSVGRFLLTLASVLLMNACGQEVSAPTDERTDGAAVEAEVGGADGEGQTSAEANRVLVFGATGRTGRRVVTQLLDKGYQVRAFVRDEQRAREKLGERVEYVTGDVRDTQSVAPAFVGVDGVISAIGSSGIAKDPSNTPEAVDYKGVKLLAETAAAAGVGHFVLVSSMGVTVEDHPLNKMFDNVLKWKFKGEQALRGSGVPYTIIRPGGLTEEPGGDSEVRFFAEDGGEGMIPRADVAAVCVAALGSEQAVNKTLSIVSGAGQTSGDFDAAFSSIPADP